MSTGPKSMLHMNHERQALTPKPNDSIDVPGLLRRRRGLLVFGTLLGISAAVFYYFIATPTYESSTEILVMTRSSAPSSSNSQDQIVHQDVLATHMELFASRKIVEAAIENQNLVRMVSIAEAIAEGDDPVEFVTDKLSVTRGGSGRGKEANIIKAAYRDISPRDCATILDALVESYQKFLGDTFLNTSGEAVELIAKAKDNLAKELKTHESAYRDFRETSPMLFTGEKTTNPYQEKIRKLEDDLAELRHKQAEITSRLEVIAEYRIGRNDQKLTDLECLSLLSEDEVGRLKVLFDVTKQDQFSKEFESEQPIRTEAARAEYDQLLTLILREKTLSSRYGDDHPQVKIARDKIVAMRGFIDTNKPAEAVDGEIDRMNPSDMLETFLESLKHDLEELQKREVRLSARLATEEGTARDMIRYELKDRAMQAESVRLNSLYDVILERLRNMNIIKDFGGFMTEVISPAKPAIKPVWPRLSILGALGSLVGFTFGVGLALLAEFTDSTFRNPGDVQQAMDLPIIAHIPKLQIDRRKRKNAALVDQSLCTLHNPGSRDAEVYRSLRTSLSFYAARDGLKVLQVTSSCPGDGKSTTAANLAVSFSQAGKSALLIDADLRRPKVDALFNLENGPGLTEVLADDAEILDVIREGAADSLHLLPAGRTPHNPAELLSSAKFANLLKTLEAKYDIIIIDTPPVLAVSDPRIVASLADGVLVALRIVKDGRAAAIHCREVLDSVGANLLGIVINSTTNEGIGHYGYMDGATKVGYGLEYGQDYYHKSTTVKA